VARTSLRPDDPTWIGRYRLMSRLGSGGMGVVYLGVGADGSQVAVKALRPELADDPEFRRRFSREVAALGRVRGVCTVRVIEADTEAPRPFMVTEYAEGPSLAEYIDSYGSLRPQMLFGLATGLAEALTAIHAAGIVHRDLKPSNVILTREGPKVIDFGIAQTMDAVSMTRTGMMVGSPGFMAPEQVSGRPGQKADIFVWGVTVAYAAAGRSPFGTGDTNAILYRVLYETPDLAPVPDRLQPLVAAALAKDPQYRPTAPELLSQLTSVSRRPAGPSQDSPTQEILAQTWLYSAPGTGASVPRPAAEPAIGSLLLDPAPRQTSRPRSRKTRVTTWVGAVTAAAVVVAATTVGVIVISKSSGRAPASRAAADQQAVSATASLPVYPGQQQRGVFQDIARIVAWGDTLVTTGSQTSDGITRQQFFVSVNGGKTWRLAPVRSASGGQPPLGLTANRIAAGPHGWMAAGSNSIWTSPDGQTWTLRAAHGIAQSGDQLLVANGTSAGYIAAGGGAGSQGLIWTSSDGVTWHRKTASQLGLVTASGSTPASISFATAFNHDTLISDGASVWLSTDGGSAWTRVSVPAGHGATSAVTGLAADGSGLLAVRAGATAGRPDGVAYFSPNGRTWQYSGTIDTTGGWTPHLVKGSNDGFVVIGYTGSRQTTGYVSTGTGGSWRPTASLGTSSPANPSGVTLGSGGSVIAVGTAHATTVSQPAVFLAASTAGNVHPVSLAGISGGLVPEVSVKSTAMAGGQQVAVGSADGYPAIWHRAAGRSWSLVTPLSLVSANPGSTALTSVTHGAAGWLAVGAPGPIALTSANGITWQRAQAATQDLAGAISAAAVAGPQGYVIVGAKLKPTSGCLPVTWWSRDLTSWTKGRDVNIADGSSVVIGVAAGPAGFVSGGAHDGKPAVWITSDGRAWTTVLLPFTAGDRAGQISQIAVSGRRVVALGQQTSAAGIVTPLAELSTDGGLSWRMVPFGSTGPGTSVTALASGAGRFTAGGQLGIPGQQDAAIWTSADGTTWARSAVNGLTGGGSQGIAALTPAGSAVTGIDAVQGTAGQKFVTVPLG
jgi:hypothetical protein